ncbi:xylulokinase [Shewanella sp. 10N.7]|uniref:xylulokinase n=1 Tax=Shewanella sp. 10N.7 TaxID=2885093 RepID=UPI001E573E92|nr:xylulokinase [Shewanella sp. 10N.7]MCC4834255.1 xylulokinase [Shewanella sp. 10N.7]
MYLGIDLGTSGVKIIILDGTGTVIAQASSPLKVSRPTPLWSEQSPQDWWQATNLAMQSLKSLHAESLAEVNAIGLSGQMHGATLLDSSNHIIRPAILWNDGRSEIQCKTIEATEKQTRHITGNIAMPGFTAPKLLWVKENEPDNFKRIAKVLLPKDYLRFLMTGDFASDMSDSAGTLWLDVEKRQWSKEMLNSTGLTIEQMPQLYEGTEITGKLTHEVAQMWGMVEVPVVAGGGDNAAGAVGIGVIAPKQAFLSLGTSGVFFVANDTYNPHPDSAIHTFCHCIPDTWHQMSVTLSAASCLTWVTELTGFKDEKSLLVETEKLDFSSPSSLIFLPYLSGERTPHNNPTAQGVFFGLTHNTTAAELCRSVLEGVAFAFADGQKALIDSGSQIENISVIGGGSRSKLWGQILASVLNRTLTYRKSGEVGPALGAARLAQIAVTQKDPVDVCFSGEVDYEIQPDLTMQDYYSYQYKKFKQLYHSLKMHF